MNNLIKGYLPVIIAACLWGTQGILGKQIMLTGFNPLTLATLRISFTFLIFLVGISLCKPNLLKIDKQDLPYFFIFGFISISCFHLCFNYAIYYTNVSTATILLYTSPVFVAILSTVFLNEKFTLYKFIAVILVVVGCAAISLGNSSSNLKFNYLGIVLAITTGLCYAFWSILGKKGLAKYSPWTVNLYSMGMGSLCLLVLNGPSNLLNLKMDHSLLCSIVIMALGNTVIPNSFYVYGLRFLEASKASMLANLELVIAVLLSYSLLKEPIGLSKIIGFISILGAIAILIFPDLSSQVAEHSCNRQNTASDTKNGII